QHTPPPTAAPASHPPPARHRPHGHRTPPRLERPRTRRTPPDHPPQPAHPARRVGQARLHHPHWLRHLCAQHTASRYTLDNRARPLTSRLWIAIVYADQPDGLQSAPTAAAALKRLGITSARMVPMNEHTTTDPTPVVIRSTEGGIQAVLLILAYDAGDRYLRAAYRLHISSVTFGSDEDTFPPSVIKD